MNENQNLDPELNPALRSVWESLTDEQREKARNCKTMDELTALAKEAGVELPDNVLEDVAGGWVPPVGRCPEDDSIDRKRNKVY